MSIALNSPVTDTIDTAAARTTGPRIVPSSRTAGRPATSRTGRRPSAAPAEAAPTADADEVTLTLTVSLPSATSDVEAAQLADALRAQALRLSADRGGQAAVAVRSPRSFSPSGPALRALPPHTQETGAARPDRKRPVGVVSPTSPARRDAEAARRRLRQATAVSPSSPSVATDTSLVIDLFGRRVRIDGEDVELTYKEFELLAHLAHNARRIVSRDELMESVWADAGEETGERTVDVHVRRVRAKLGRFRRLISTVRGSGYRLDTGSDVAILG
jgi:hypothetical protein